MNYEQARKNKRCWYINTLAIFNQSFSESKGHSGNDFVEICRLLVILLIGE